jgi:hypothetical protein
MVSGTDYVGMDADSDELSPDEAFWLLGDQMRTAILHAVWESSEEPITFTEIRDRIGRPDSGKFNYHLDKLVGQFLSKGEGGYTLTQAGRDVVRAVMAGTLTQKQGGSPRVYSWEESDEARTKPRAIEVRPPTPVVDFIQHYFASEGTDGGQTNHPGQTLGSRRPT